jgi:hypothetical protein
MDGVPLCNTCEDPWNENTRGESCIPKGVYKFVPHNGQLYKNVWVALNVPNRTGILIHSGNTIKDTRGCLLVGNGFGTLDGMPGVLNSVQTLEKLRGILPPEFILTII